MNRAEVYMKLKSDLAGSRSKNRFRIELLWGIDKMLELMETSENFTMVFDYVCDIEVHKEDSFEFYQVKTHKDSQTSYTPSSLVKRKANQEGSILGKLFALVEDGENVKVTLVCNKPFPAISTDLGLTSLDNLSNDDKKIILEAIKKELGVERVDFSKSFYLYTHMNLADPENEIKGALVSSFERIKGSEPQNPNALYRLVYDEVCDRASYEFALDDYDKLLDQKGISRVQFDRILDAHCSNEKTGVASTMTSFVGLCSTSDIHEDDRFSRTKNEMY